MVSGPSPLPHALHTHLLLLAQPDRAMVRAADRQTTAPRRPHIGLRAGKRHPRLDRQLEPGPQALRLDQDRRRDPRTTRLISTSNSWRRTLGHFAIAINAPGCIHRMICTRVPSSIATHPAVGPPSVACKKKPEPLPGTRASFTPITTECTYSGMSRFSLADVSNGHCSFLQRW